MQADGKRQEPPGIPPKPTAISLQGSDDHLAVLPLVGREPELALLRERLATSASGRGGLLLLGGEAGAGKTSLLTAVAQEARGFITVTGRSRGAGETPAFGPWLELTAELRPDPAALPPPFGTAERLHDTYDLAVSLAEWLAGLSKPILAALEDLHWADSASLELLRFMAPRLQRLPVLLVATYRSDELHRTHPLWTLLPDLLRGGAERLTAERLSAQSVAALAAHVLPDKPGVQALARRIHERTGGNALFVRELLNAAARTGTTNPELPETIQQAIDLRLRRAGPAALQALQAAAVIGERFDYDLLVRVADLPEEELDSALEEAVRLHVIRTEGTAAETFSFDHALVREALLNRLIGLKRRRWHLRTGEALLARAGYDPESVGLHLGKAGDPRAGDYLLMAAHRAFRLGALKQAESLFERALELMSPDDRRRGETLLKLGVTLSQDQGEKRIECAEEAEAAAEAAGDQVVAVAARHARAAIAFQRGDIRCIDLMERVEAEEEQLLKEPRYRQLEQDLFGEPRGYPMTAVLRGRALCRAGRLREAEAVAARLRGVALSASGLYAFRHLLRYIWFFTADPEILSELTRNGNHKEQGAVRRFPLAVGNRIFRIYADLIVQADNPDLIDRTAEEVPALDAMARERSGYSVISGEGYSPLGFYQFLRGDWEAARRNLLEYFDRFSPVSESFSLLFAAEMKAAMGDPAGGLALLRTLPPLGPDEAPGLVQPALQVRPQLLRARLLIANGDLGGARAWLECADRWLAQRQMALMGPGVHLAWALFERAAGNGAGAQARAEQAVESARAINECRVLIEAYRLLGELASESGRTGAADEHFQASLELSRRCRFPYEEALTELAWGRRDLLEHARETLARLGALPALIRAEALAGADGAGKAEPQALPDGLTEREVEVILRVAEGLTDREIAAALFISPRTVDGHLRNIFNKVGVSNRAALASYAARAGLLR